MEELDLKELLKIFWEKKITIIVIVAIFLVIGYIYTMKIVVPTYSASTTLVLTSSNKNNNTNSITTSDVTINAKLLSTYSELIESDMVLSNVISNLNLNIDVNRLRKNITVSTVENTELIKIKVVDESPANATKITNEIGNVFIKKVAEIYNINNVQKVDEPQVSNSLLQTNHKRDLIIFAIAGLVVSSIYIILLNMIDTTVKNEKEIEQDLHVPVLVSIPICTNGARKKKGGNK